MEVLGQVEAVCVEHPDNEQAGCSTCVRLARIAEKLGQLKEHRKVLVEELCQMCLKRTVVVLRLR